jgi:hypothetical protein
LGSAWHGVLEAGDYADTSLLEIGNLGLASSGCALLVSTYAVVVTDPAKLVADTTQSSILYSDIIGHDGWRPAQLVVDTAACSRHTALMALSTRTNAIANLTSVERRMGALMLQSNELFGPSSSLLDLSLQSVIDDTCNDVITCTTLNGVVIFAVARTSEAIVLATSRGLLLSSSITTSSIIRWSRLVTGINDIDDGFQSAVVSGVTLPLRWVRLESSQACFGVSQQSESFRDDLFLFYVDSNGESRAAHSIGDSGHRQWNIITLPLTLRGVWNDATTSTTTSSTSVDLSHYHVIGATRDPMRYMTVLLIASSDQPPQLRTLLWDDSDNSWTAGFAFPITSALTPHVIPIFRLTASGLSILLCTDQVHPLLLYS